MKRLVFVKLGGSLITDKTKPFTVRREIIESLATQIKKALDEDHDLKLLIGTGAGSFGHYSVVKHKMENGIKTADQVFGYAEVEDSVARLARIVVAKLLEKGIPAVTCAPSSVIIAKNNACKTFFIEPIIRFLDSGMIPVVHGDIVFDEAVGSSIFSTERIFRELIVRFKKRKIKVDTVIHVGITDGVFDENGETIQKITKEDFKKIAPHLFKANGIDVTGGMKHKVEESLNLTKYGVRSLIINGLLENFLERALRAKKVKGTFIE